ncbi:HPF/RaiA family ribosome-associated protein [Micromonospora endophytica]|uniref:HPF/RaiA family ribosome-associated protein n=1 Tax=Micromonospora endophytica TaxID=515350 RepID=UPI001C34002E|nr:HPF/RaiA family ribosome-associated protein [Micromonospora endophytica]BCJ60647.1 hypothetical protein Jiend_40690 [Micromonospora endophytica]
MNANPATVEKCLRFNAGFSQGDQNWIIPQFGTLDARLATFDADATDLELSIKDRETKGQRVTLECRIAGWPKIVTTSSEEDLRAALNDVRDDLRRKLNDAKTKHEPRNNKHLRVAPPPAQPEELLDLPGDDLAGGNLTGVGTTTDER